LATLSLAALASAAPGKSTKTAPVDRAVEWQGILTWRRLHILQQITLDVFVFFFTILIDSGLGAG
jgi:hypothetical protein